MAEQQPTSLQNPAHGLGSDSSADDHLMKMLTVTVDKPWYQTFFHNVKDAIHPPKQPPLEVTSKPVPVKDIWGFSGGQEKRAGVTSMLLHVAMVALVFAIGTNETVQQTVKETVTLVAPDIAPYLPEMKPKEHSWAGEVGGVIDLLYPLAKGVFRG